MVANIPRREVRRLPVIAEVIFCVAVMSMPSVLAWSFDEETMVDPAKASSFGNLSWFCWSKLALPVDIVLAIGIIRCTYIQMFVG